MALEIERKFLVNNEDYKNLASRKVRIIQGYLSSVPARTVRVRVKGEKGYLTIKGIGNESGASRYEWEREISVSEAQELLKICEPGVIDKTRYLVDYAGHIYEVDEFYQSNQGLVIAEVELIDENQTVNKPDWLGEEVTGDTRYYNSMLMKQPFTTW